MPSVELFSLLLTIGVLGLGSITTFVVVAYFLSPAAKIWLQQVPYELYLKLIGAITISSTLSALTYQFYYQLPVCELCWWQRICLFPIDIIVLVALGYRVTAAHIMIGILAVAGLLFASFHYYYHFQIFVLGKTLPLSCAVYGLVPGCTTPPIVVFKFVTLPFMGVVMFLVVIALCYLGGQSKRV